MQCQSRLDAVQRNASANDCSENQDCVVTIAADVDEHWVIDSIYASYDGGSTGGTVKVEFDGTKVFELYLIDPRPATINFPPGGLHNGDWTTNEACVITLTAPGPFITGKLNVVYR